MKKRSILPVVVTDAAKIDASTDPALAPTLLSETLETAATMKIDRNCPLLPRLTRLDRALWSWLSRGFDEWRASLVIVKPEPHAARDLLRVLEAQVAEHLAWATADGWDALFDYDVAGS